MSGRISSILLGGAAALAAAGLFQIDFRDYPDPSLKGPWEKKRGTKFHQASPEKQAARKRQRKARAKTRSKA